MNSVQIIGRLTKDVETRAAGSGTTIGKFSIAVNQRVKNGDQWEDQPHFFDCTAFGKTADGIARFFGKGALIALECRLAQESWEDKQTGQKRSKVGLIVNRWHFCGGKSEGNQTAQATTTAGGASLTAGHVPLADGDIPFTPDMVDGRAGGW